MFHRFCGEHGIHRVVEKRDVQRVAYDIRSLGLGPDWPIHPDISLNMAPEDWFVLAQAATDIEQNSTRILSALTDCSPCVSDAQVARRKPAVAQRLFEPQPGGWVRFRRDAIRRPNHSGQDDAGATA